MFSIIVDAVTLQTSVTVYTNSPNSTKSTEIFLTPYVAITAAIHYCIYDFLTLK